MIDSNFRSDATVQQTQTNRIYNSRGLEKSPNHMKRVIQQSTTETTPIKDLNFENYDL